MSFDPSKFAKRFCIETREKLEIMRGLTASGPLEQNTESLDEVRKTLHSLRGVANMLKFTTTGLISMQLEDILKAMLAGELPSKPGVNQMIDTTLDVIESEIVLLEENFQAEQKDHPIMPILKSVLEGGEFNFSANKSDSIKKSEPEKKITKERFLKKFLGEAEGYISELSRLNSSLDDKTVVETWQTEMKNVVHAFKGSSKLLGFTELFTNLDKLEDFFIENLKAGRNLPKDFHVRLQSVISNLSTILSQVPTGQTNQKQAEELTQSVAAVVTPLLETAVQETSVENKYDDEDDEPEPIVVQEASKGKKFDRSMFINKFVDESLENTELLADTLLELEKNLGEVQFLRECMRLAHILKGSARMMGFKYQGGLLHRLEDLFNEFVNNDLKVTENHVEMLLTSVDHLKANLLNIKKDGTELPHYQELLAALDFAIAKRPFDLTTLGKKSSGSDTIEAPTPITTAISQTSAPIVVPASSAPTPKTEQPSAEETADAAGVNIRKFGDTIRINTVKLDSTIKLVGELLVNRQRSQIRLSELQHYRKLMKSFIYQLSGTVTQLEDEVGRELIRQSERLFTMLEGQVHRYREDLALNDLIVNELQTNTIKMRMEPLNVIFNSFPRAVRDMAKQLNKQIELVIQGDDTELDRKMIEKLTDPLIHLLRNSADHGIETPEDRVKIGKPVKGLVRIQALTEGSNIVIHIEDDGRGIDIQKIKEKALQKKLFKSEDDLNSLNEFEVMKLIFMPNFSTAKIITDISGRGVGLDIVKKNIEDLKGFISVDSIYGKGTKFTIKLPLTLTTLRSIVCEAGGQKWAIPISSIKQTLVLDKKEVIEIVDRDAIRLDNQIISLVRLSRALSLNDTSEFPEKLMIIVGYYGKEQIAFVVDDIMEEIEVVIKPVPSVINKINNISAVTVSLNGEIIPIVFMPELISSAKRVQEGLKEPIVHAKGRENQAYVLVVDDSLNTREIEKTILEAYGYRVDTGRDGLDGYEKAMETQYDLIVSDLEMPRLNGFGLIERLRQVEKYKHTPIIIVTSRENENDKRRGIEVGANAYIIKGSFDQTSLIDTIESLLA